jgi:preprotein translocase subunit SecD
MNRYPLWKYLTVAFALLFGLVYTLPNFFGESPAVQVSSAKATLKVDDKTRERVASTLQTAGIESSGIFLDSNGVKVRLRSTRTPSCRPRICWKSSSTPTPVTRSMSWR